MIAPIPRTCHYRMGLAPICCALVVLGAASHPTPAGAQTTATGRGAGESASVLELLSGIEDVPTADELRATGERGAAQIAQLAESRTQPGFIRLRAIQALGVIATPHARAVLRRQLRDAEPLVVRQAALALQRAFGTAAEIDLIPLLTHQDIAVREAAIAALSATGSARARAAMRARLTRESDPVLRRAIEAAVAPASMLEH